MSNLASKKRWSIVLPYVNETAFISATLISLVHQSLKDFELILVDNGSDDGTEALCRVLLKPFPDVTVRYLSDARPGKTHALETGIAAASSQFVATCDADTTYPLHYLARCDRLYEQGGEGLVAVMALDIYGDANSIRWRMARHWKVLVSRLLAKQTHTGGYGQTFRLDALRRVGGYSVAQWPYVLEDHEIMHRLFKIGRSRYDASLWCHPSDRRADRSNVGWTLPERILYHATPYAGQGWFFYTFLANRLKARGMGVNCLRLHRSWEAPSGEDRSRPAS